MQDDSGPLPARPSKTISVAPDQVASKPWYQSVQINGAVLGIASAIMVVCHAFHIKIPFSESELTAGIGGLVTIATLLYWIYKRIRVGNDPASTAAPLTLK